MVLLKWVFLLCRNYAGVENPIGVRGGRAWGFKGKGSIEPPTLDGSYKGMLSCLQQLSLLMLHED